MEQVRQETSRCSGPESRLTMQLTSKSELPEVITQVHVHHNMINRLQSDFDSEKGTRARVNSDFLNEIRIMKEENAKSNRTVHIAMGAWFGTQFIIGLALALWGLLKSTN